MQEDDLATQEEMLRILGDMQLTPAQADVMFNWVQLQNTVLVGLATGVEWASSEENISAFSKRAEDVGLPVGALILSSA